MIALLLTLACATDDVDPRVPCEQDGSFECCSNDDCGADEVCFYLYTCVTINGRLSCEEPTGDNTCHPLCDAGDPDCPGLTDTCQTIEFAQGTDYYEDVSACF